MNPDRRQSLLPRGEQIGQVLAKVRDAGHECRDRLGERASDEDDDEHDRPDKGGVDEDDGADPGQDREEASEAADDRAEDERQEPRQEEDEDRVAERVEDVAEVADEDQREDDRAQDEHRGQPAPLSVGHLHHPGSIIVHVSPW